MGLTHHVAAQQQPAVSCFALLHALGGHTTGQAHRRKLSAGDTATAMKSDMHAMQVAS